MGSSSLPPQLGGPKIGRPVSDSDEYTRVSSALQQMMSPAALQGGEAFKNLLPFYNALLVGSTLHVGNAAMSIVPTACVFFGKDGRLNLAFNPYYLDEIQRILVHWPADAQEEDFLISGGERGRRSDKNKGLAAVGWLVRPSFSRLPPFVRASILRQQIRENLLQAVMSNPQLSMELMVKLAPKGLSIQDLRTEDLIDALRMPPEVQVALWTAGPQDLGIPSDRPIAVQVDNSKLIALCVHEILHVAHLHLLVDRERFTDPRLLNMAMDMAIDQHIDGVPDDLWEFHKKLFDLCGEPPLEADKPFDHYYALLEDFYKRNGNKTVQTPNGPVKIVMGPVPPGTPIPSSSPSSGCCPTCGQCSSTPPEEEDLGSYDSTKRWEDLFGAHPPGHSCPTCGKPVPKPGEGQEGEGQEGEGQPGQGQPGQGQPGQGQPGQGQPGQGQPGQGQPGGTPAPGGLPGSVGPDGTITIYVPSTPDDHTVWGGKPTKIDELSTSAWLEEFKKKAGENPKWGQGLGDVLRRIEEFLKPKVRWQPILKRFIGQAIRVGHEATRKRPSRRLGWDAPGKKTVRGGRVLFAIDNSGSVTALEAGQFFGEISSLIGQVEIIVAIWDTAVRQVVKIQSKNDLRRLAENLGGGGGTYVFPVFEGLKNPGQISDPKVRALFSNIQALVVLTDGDLEWPGPEWDILPTLWGITKESNVKAPKFGIPLYINLLDG